MVQLLISIVQLNISLVSALFSYGSASAEVEQGKYNLVSNLIVVQP